MLTPNKRAPYGVPNRRGPKSERERQGAGDHKVSGCYRWLRHASAHRKNPVWIADYVLAGYGTGAIIMCQRAMSALEICQSVRPAHSRHFRRRRYGRSGLHREGHRPVQFWRIQWQSAGGSHPFGHCLPEEKGVGTGQINYHARCGFSRQRYRGEPSPFTTMEKFSIDPRRTRRCLQWMPICQLRTVTRHWQEPKKRIGMCPRGRMEYNTMPGWAGSSWYFLRAWTRTTLRNFAPATNRLLGTSRLVCGRRRTHEGHPYSRFLTKFLFDRGWIGLMNCSSG